MPYFLNILIISESLFSLDNGFGITPLILFEGCPKESLVILYTENS